MFKPPKPPGLSRPPRPPGGPRAPGMSRSSPATPAAGGMRTGGNQPPYVQQPAAQLRPRAQPREDNVRFARGSGGPGRFSEGGKAKKAPKRAPRKR